MEWSDTHGCPEIAKEMHISEDNLWCMHLFFYFESIE